MEKEIGRGARNMTKEISQILTEINQILYNKEKYREQVKLFIEIKTKDMVCPLCGDGFKKDEEVSYRDVTLVHRRCR